MRAVVQRVKSSSVRVNGECVGEIGKGLNVLLGVCEDDTERDADYLAEKAAGLRIFDDADGKTNLSIIDKTAEDEEMGMLIISQFTCTVTVEKENDRRLYARQALSMPKNYMNILFQR